MTTEDPPPSPSSQEGGGRFGDNDNDWIDVKFVPFSSSVDSSFWVKYCQEKLDTIQLCEEPLPFQPFYSVIPSSVSVITTPSSSSSSPRLICDEPAISPQQSSSSCNERVSVHSRLLGYNSMETFQSVDKNKVLRDTFVPLFMQGKLESLTSVLLVTFADLKHFRVVYWFGFPSFATPIRAVSLSCQTFFDATLASRLHALRRQQQQQMQQNQSLFPYFLLTRDKKCCLLSKESYERAFNENQDEEMIFGFFDPTRAAAATAPSSDDDASGSIAKITMGWPLRNLIAYLCFHLNLGGKTVKILSYRPLQVRRLEAAEEQQEEDETVTFAATTTVCSIVDDEASSSSLVVSLRVPTRQEYGCSSTTTLNEPESTGDGAPAYRIVGWELNARSKPGPRAVNLRPLLDPKHLAIQAADLNLKLMKWRMIPNLQVDVLQNRVRALIIGAGTLGCNVARVLLAWGIRQFDFVDNAANVSYSNPVRQSLFTLQDCAESTSKPKAVAAALALETIAANVQSRGHVFSIPMPGHPEFKSVNDPNLVETVEKLDALVRACDVIFLLTDTRESRWLPSVAAAAHNKMLINAALGLDSWLVMRHGGGFPSTTTTSSTATNQDKNSTAATTPTPRLGCYFCNDIVAPENSTRNRTLDQQCTVTRPGLAPIASSMAAELMVALLHHPRRHLAPPPTRPVSSSSTSASNTNFSPIVPQQQAQQDDSTTTDLGVIPHQIRGSLVSYTMMTPSVPAFVHCTACSRPVVGAYLDNKMDLVWNACNSSSNSTFLEDLTGLSGFRTEAAAKVEEMMMVMEEDDNDEWGDNIE